VPVQRSQISPVGSIDSTECQQLHTVAFLAIQPNVLHRHSYTQLQQRWRVRRAASIAACCLSVPPCLVYAGVHAVQVQSVTGSCLSTCSQCEVLLKILNLHITASHLWTVSCRLHLACNMPCTQCLQGGAQQTPSPRMLHAPVAHCFDCLASRQHVVAVFSAAAHMQPGTPRAQPASLCCTLYEQHTPCCTHTQTHACMLCFLFPIPSNRMIITPCAPLPSMYFTHMPATPVGCVSYACALPSMYISHTWLRRQLQKALACCGLGLAAV
jgi:hypothetical protein